MLLSPNTIPIAYRPPFAYGATPWRDVRPHGETVLDIVRSVPALPREFLSRGVVCINGDPVPRELWSYTRPKPTTENLPIAVTLHYPLGSPGGGGSSGSGGSKQIIGLVAAIALIAVATAISGGALGVAGGIFGGAFLFGAGSTSAALLAGAVTVAGALAISALTAPPTTQQAAQIADTNTENKEASAAQGNVIDPGGSIPRVIGSRKIYPPFICEPLVELVDDDEFVEALYALNGPHLLEDIRIDGTDISAAEDVQFESFEGWSTDSAPTLITRQGKTITPQIALSQHKLGDDNQLLLDQANPENDLPVWHGFVTRDSPDEVWVHVLFPGGITVAGSTSNFNVPFRIRARRRGDTDWINFPEVHVTSNSSDQLRLAILFRWMTPITPLVQVGTRHGFVYAHIAPSPQVSTPASPEAWVADSYFDNGGAGGHYLDFATESTTRIRNLNLYKNRVEFYLDPGTFIPGIWEIEIKRGHTIFPSNFSGNTYIYNGQFRDFFWYQSASPNAQIAQGQNNVSDHAIITRVVSVWNDPPYTPTDKYFALIAIKARNRQIQKLSVQASGYVKNWDGSDWNTWTTTSNPAPHYVDVLSGEQNLDPLDTTLRDDDGLVYWRDQCFLNNWTCDAIIDDMRTQDVLALLASCAYAKPYQSDVYSVTIDNDKSEEAPIQVFSRINAANVKFEKAFVRAPAGFIVSYRDESTDDDRAQVIVLQRDSSIATTGLFETISYDGLIETDKVQARALFDLDQANQRSTFYSFETDIESIVCRRGSLVALQHDVLTSRAGDGHVYSKQKSGTNIIGITLDAEIDIVGGNTGVAIRRRDGTITTHEISNGTGSTAALTFTTPFGDDDTILTFADTNREYGSLVVAGELSSEYKRMLVLQVTPGTDLRATVTLVDEAPDLVRF